MIAKVLDTWARRWIAVATLVIALHGALLALWAFDRAPPYQFARVVQAQRIGDDGLLLVQQVRRIRYCDVTATARYLESQFGNRIYLPDVSFTAEEIAAMQSDRPDQVRLLLTFHPTDGATRWRYHVRLEYTCNPLHRIWPIVVAYYAPFEVH